MPKKELANYKRLGSLMSDEGQRLVDASDDEDTNERTILELVMMQIGADAEQEGVGNDVIRWIRNGVINERSKQ